MKELSEEQKLYRKEIAKKLAGLRNRMGITQQQVADKLQTQKSNISRLESGEQNISLDYLIAYADAINSKPVLVMEDELEVGYGPTEYSLKLYDEELITFSMARTFEGTTTVELLSAKEELKHLFPMNLELSSAGLRAWLKTRCIPKNRAYVQEILESFNLEARDLKGIIDVCKGLSLNDSYWIVEKGSDLKFDKINLYENSFDEALSLVAFVGMMQPRRRSSSPEFTTGGTLRKGWRRINGETWLYKGGMEDSGYPALEPYSEYYACQIAKAMGLNAIEYELTQWKGILASRCKLFTTKDISYVAVGDIDGVYEIEDVLLLYQIFGQDFYEQLCDMLVFDALVYNQDRHFGNFGLLRDNKTGKYIAPAPIFDNGMSLFPHAIRSDFDNLDSYRGKCNNPYERSWEQILSLALGDKQKEKLKRLEGFKFEEHPLFNLPEWRTKALEEFIQKRIKEII